MEFVDVLGAVAVVVSSASLVPQIIKTWRTRSAGDFAYGWLFAALLAAALWLGYGVLKADWAVIAGNIIVGAMVASLVAMKWRYSKG